MSKKTTVDLYVPDDLEATLWAESPMLNNPTNMDVDARGRVWITEAVNYRNFNNDSTRFLHHDKGDRVVILEDRDQDGRADTAITFVQDEGLRSPVGIAVFGNQVVVSCSPNLIVYTDDNGDDHADRREVLLTGFGGFDHDHSLHAVFGGADGNWYFNTGNAGPHHVTDRSGWTLRSGSLYTGGTPYNQANQGNQVSDDGGVYVGGLALRISPAGRSMKVMGHNFRNSYEVFPDSYGNLWQNDNDDQVVTCRTSWLMEGGNAGYFSSDGTRFWQADQRPGQDIFRAHWHQDDPGVMPAGDRTGAGAPTGILRIETAELGEAYRGMLLSADAGRNVIFGYTPRVAGAGYDLGKRRNLITSLSGDNEGYVWNDSAGNARKESWFRPSDVAIGTDCAMYVADWFDPVVGGHQMQDTAGYGRIYRITPKNKKLSRPAYDLATLSGQLAAFGSAAINVRFTAAQLIQQQGEKVIPELKKLVAGEDPFLQARAVWLLARIGGEGLKAVASLAASPSVNLRAVAVRALRQHAPDLELAMQPFVADTSSFVRREILLALVDQPETVKRKYLITLVKSYPPGDRWYLETLGMAMQHQAGTWYKIVRDSLGGSNPRLWDKRMADIAWRLHPKEAVPDFSLRILDSGLSLAQRQQSLTALAFVPTREGAMAMLRLSEKLTGDLHSQAIYWLAFRQDNDWAAFLPKSINRDLYSERKDADMRVNWQTVMDKRQPDNERNGRLDAMIRDSAGGRMLLDLVESGRVPEEWQQRIGGKIFDNPDPGVRLRARKFFEWKETPLNASQVLAFNGNAATGKNRFMKYCSSCHMVGDVGGAIGPELTGISSKLDRPALIDAVLHPDAAIVFGYDPVLVKDKKGFSVFGFLESESPDRLLIKDLSGRRITVNVKDIVSRERQSHSLMPSAAAMKLQPAELADIIAFLEKNR